MSRAARLALVLYGAAACVYLLDRSTKLLAENYLAGRAPIRLVPHVLDLTYTTNSGGAFGLFRGQPWLFFAASLVVCIAIVVASRHLASLPVALGLGLILGGAVGNLTDRVIHGSGATGRVVDFIYLHAWPVFNAADSAIVIGTFVVVIASLWRPEPERAAHREANGNPSNRATAPSSSPSPVGPEAPETGTGA